MERIGKVDGIKGVGVECKITDEVKCPACGLQEDIFLTDFGVGACPNGCLWVEDKLGVDVLFKWNGKEVIKLSAIATPVIR